MAWEHDLPRTAAVGHKHSSVASKTTSIVCKNHYFTCSLSSVVKAVFFFQQKCDFWLTCVLEGTRDIRSGDNVINFYFSHFKKPKNIPWVRVAWIRNYVFQKNKIFWFLLSGWTVVSKTLKKRVSFTFFDNPYSCNPYSRDGFEFWTKNENITLGMYGVFKNEISWKIKFWFSSKSSTFGPFRGLVKTPRSLGDSDFGWFRGPLKFGFALIF